MTWYAWLMVALLVTSSVLTILLIGRPRQPTTAGVAVVILVVNSLYMWGVLSLAGAA